MSIYTSAVKTLRSIVGGFLDHRMNAFERQCYDKASEFLMEINQKNNTKVQVAINEALKEFPVTITEINVGGIRKFSFHSDLEWYKEKIGFAELEKFDLGLFSGARSLAPSGICDVSVPLENFVSREDVVDYIEVYRLRHSLRRHFVPEGLTYTQMLSMFPLISKLWVGPTPKIRPGDLSKFGYRDNHDLNNVLEMHLTKAMISGETYGIEVHPYWGHSGNVIQSIFVKEKESA